MKLTLEYLELLGVTRNQVLWEHLKILLIKILKSKTCWFLLGVIVGTSTIVGFSQTTKVLVSNYTNKEIIYIPAISIDSNTRAFMDAIATFESGGLYTITNGQYLGKYQIGDDMRTQLGYASLNTKAGRIQFVNTPELQDIIMLQSIRYSAIQLSTYISKYSNTKVGSHYLTKSGIIAIAHACGIQGCKSFIDSKGQYVPNNGRRITDYLQFNNFKL
jgi:hypothetical protein